MILDDATLKDGLKFIVGDWEADFIVNAFSNDLAHIPASEFKSDDGRDFSSLKFSFFEDHTVLLSDPASGKEEKGVWEQTGMLDYHYSFDAFFEIPEGDFKKNAETLSVQDGRLVFAIGFLAIALKKTADGEITKEPDIGDLEGDDSMTDIVGKYSIFKAMALIGEDFDLFTREEVLANADKQLAAGEIDEEEYNDALKPFDGWYEFTPDHKIVCWMKIPAGVTEEMIKEAIEAGEIGEVRDGCFAMGEQEWKAVGGKYYYDTGEYRETFGEVQSSWDELGFDGDGLLTFGSGMLKLKKQ